MKKIFAGITALFLANLAIAAGANKMTMVTYFPVKYVAYSQVDVTKQMDVGLTSACQMNLGCSADDGFDTGKSLRVNNLLKVAGGKLELNDAPAIVGNTAFIGSGNGTADFDFETNLRIGNYKQGYTLQTDNMYLSELNLFGYKFPACSGSTMSWQKLKLKNTEEVYLACGEPEKIPFNGCSACSSYDENSTEYENCVLNNVSSCCQYAYDIYTKRGQNAFELMKNTSCYTCNKEHQNGVDHDSYSFVTTPSAFQYYTGSDYTNAPTANSNSVNCLTYIPLGQTQHFYPINDLSYYEGRWEPFDVCPDDGTCGGKGSCIYQCTISACSVFNTINGKVDTIQCRFSNTRRLCDSGTDCVRNW